MFSPLPGTWEGNPFVSVISGQAAVGIFDLAYPEALVVVLLHTGHHFVIRYTLNVSCGQCCNLTLQLHWTRTFVTHFVCISYDRLHSVSGNWYGVFLWLFIDKHWHYLSAKAASYCELIYMLRYIYIYMGNRRRNQNIVLRKHLLCFVRAILSHESFSKFY